MNVAIISRGDHSSGGAGRVATLLAQGLSSAGVSVRHIVRVKPLGEKSSNCEHLGGLPGDILLRNALGIDLSGIRLIFSDIAQWADIVHFHDVAVAYGIRTAIKLANKMPIVITLHDFSLISGGCLYPKGCQRYRVQCGKCPQIGNSPLPLPFDTTYRHFRLHAKLLTSPYVTLVSPSNYLMSETLSGAGRNSRIIHINNPVDTGVFNSTHRTCGRIENNLSFSDKAVLFIAHRIDDPRKGFLNFFKIYRNFAKDKKNLILILVGMLSDESVLKDNNNARIKYLGPISNSFELAKIYASSDCTVVPSLDDNVPCTISESLCCGTPVISTNVGGLSEMFEDNNHGLIIRHGSTEEWSNALNKVLYSIDDVKRAMISLYANDHYSIETAVKKYMRLYLRIAKNAHRVKNSIN